MNWTALLLFAVVAALLLGALIYWAIWITEGAYFGARAVRWLYDRGARSYDGVKEYDPADEGAFLGNPLFSRLEEDFGPHSLLLDVATGTARLPLALLAIPFYEGEIVGIDLSREMLRESARKTHAYRNRLTLLHHPAVPLPFEDDTFDAVTSLEALEFLPDRRAALEQMVRVLRPGGWFIVTNRIGSDARLMPGRTDSPAQFEALLASLGLADILTRPWQEYYDLIFARKPGAPAPGRGFSAAWLTALSCPDCALPDSIDVQHGEAHCRICGGVIEIAEDGVWELLGGRQ